MSEHCCKIWIRLEDFETYKDHYKIPDYCGDGCWVIDNVQYCPWCGNRIDTVEENC